MGFNVDVVKLVILLAKVALVGTLVSAVIQLANAGFNIATDVGSLTTKWSLPNGYPVEGARWAFDLIGARPYLDAFGAAVLACVLASLAWWFFQQVTR